MKHMLTYFKERYVALYLFLNYCIVVCIFPMGINHQLWNDAKNDNEGRTHFRCLSICPHFVAFIQTSIIWYRKNAFLGFSNIVHWNFWMDRLLMIKCFTTAEICLYLWKTWRCAWPAFQMSFAVYNNYRYCFCLKLRVYNTSTAFPAHAVSSNYILGIFCRFLCPWRGNHRLRNVGAFSISKTSFSTIGCSIIKKGEP